MICKNCGKELAVNEMFCSACGTKNLALSQLVSEPVEDVVIKKIDSARAGKTKAISMIAIGVLLAIEGVVYMDMGHSALESLGKFFIFLGVVISVLSVYTYMLYQKRFCLIKSNSVCGVTCGTIDLMNEDFEFNYDDVVSVQKKKLMQTVCVQTKYKKVNIFLPKKEMNYVYDIIQQKAKM